MRYSPLLLNLREQSAFCRLVNKPPRFVGKTAVEHILHVAPRVGGNLLSAARMVCPDLLKKSALGLSQFLDVIEDTIQVLKGAPQEAMSMNAMLDSSCLIVPEKDKGLARLLIMLFDRLGLIEYSRREDQAHPAADHIATLQCFINLLAPYPVSMNGLHSASELLILNKPIEKESELSTVWLSTMHAAKGLEFPRVIVTGLEQDVLPASIKDPDLSSHLDSERRIFYVALTRASNRLYLTSADSRCIRGLREFLEFNSGTMVYRVPKPYMMLFILIITPHFIHFRSLNGGSFYFS